MKWAPKLDHMLRCIMEQLTQPVEGQYDCQETTATHTASCKSWVALEALANDHSFGLIMEPQRSLA